MRFIEYIYMVMALGMFVLTTGCAAWQQPHDDPMLANVMTMTQKQPPQLAVKSLASGEILPKSDSDSETD